MKFKCTLPDGTIKILENVTEVVLDRIPADWKVEKIVEESRQTQGHKDSVGLATDFHFVTESEVKNIEVNSKAEANKVIRDIQDRYFKDFSMVLFKWDIPERANVLGQALTGRGIVRLNPKLFSSSRVYLEQVVYHELLHMKYPGERHTGPNFRREEYNNPFRMRKTNRLSCVS